MRRRPSPHITKCRRARTIQNIRQMTPGEKQIFHFLRNNINETIIPNMAIDKFNVDIAIPNKRLAIEINGGGWHNSPRKKRQDFNKANFLKTINWQVCSVRFNNGEFPYPDIISLFNFIGLSESKLSEYGMTIRKPIRGWPDSNVYYHLVYKPFA